MSSTPRRESTNRLCHATSPYLQQHAHNPVDWYEWGPEALAAARAADKPIFLSIGYSACHWCHVMAHESFEHADIAAVMNAHFVNIKVDREERPDLDDLFMQATLALNQGQGGWPMSVWLTPEGLPFCAGTYFPPTTRCGRPGFREVCERIAEVWHTDRNRIGDSAAELVQAIRTSLESTPTDSEDLSLATVDAAAAAVADLFDAEHGGILSGQSNKFPPSMALELLMRVSRRRPADDAMRERLTKLVTLTLDHMAAGGIHDQLGGGFHRYSTDPHWHVPHFEKMLYDQALVAGAYLDAYQLFGRDKYARVARATLDYVLDDLQAPEGGFYSARDADSEGVEGKHYVWTRDEIIATLGPEDGELICACYDVSADGNWHDPHAPDEPKNVLRIRRNEDCCAKFFNTTPQDCRHRHARAREQLSAVRRQRVAPQRDDKVLCEWNGLMIATLARGGCILAAPHYVAAAARAAEFILAEMRNGPRLRRAWRDGRSTEVAFLTDYAAFITGLLELYEATFERRWLDAARELNDVLLAHYWDAECGGFFFTPDDHETLLVRMKDVRDGAVPSGNSLQLLNLLRLAAISGDDTLRTRAEQTIAAFAERVRSAPWAAERFLSAVEFARGGPVEIAVIGSTEDERTQSLLRVVYQTYLPNRVLLVSDPAHPDAAPASPLLQERVAVDDQPTAYVCSGGTCRPPITTPADLAATLAQC